MSITTLPSLFGVLAVSTLTATVCSDVVQSQPPVDPDLYSIVPEKNFLEHEYQPHSLMMRFRESASPEARAELLASVGGTIVTSYHLVPDLVEVDIELTVPEALSRVGNRGDVLQYVEPNFIFRAFATPNDPLYSNLYGMEAINAPEAWDDFTGDPDFVIAIIDTGLDYNHQDIAANAWRNTAEIAGNGQDDDGNGYVDDVYGYDFANNEGDPMDSNSHGTHCGGTVGGVGNNGVGVAGVNWQCQLAGVQFLSSGGSGSTADAVSAVQYCAVMDFPVSNNSWGGGGFTAALYDAINNAGIQDGHIFCAAAGNGGYSGASYPAAYDLPNIIAVAATDSNDNLASFSQYHPSEVDMGAPGVDVLSCTPGNGYDYYSGTSMATPHVAGCVGMVYAVMGESASAAEVKALLMDNVRPVSALNGACVSGGIVDLEAALANTFLGPQVELLTSVPESLDPNVATTWRIRVDPREDTLVPGSVVMYYRMNGGSFSSMAMTSDGVQTWNAELPGAACDESPEFYFQAQGQTAGAVNFPSSGSGNPLGLFIGDKVISFEDDFSSDTGWSVSGDALDGGWGRGIPVTNCDRGNPVSDYDGSAYCFLTDNSSANGCNSDVDDGTTILLSPVFDASGSNDTIVSYARWHSNNYGDNPGTDPMVVDISNDGGSSWTNLETVGPTGEGTTGGWVYVSTTVADVITPSSQMRIRFTVSDLGSTQSVVESGVDAFTVEYIECDPGTPCLADLDGNGTVDVNDLLEIIAQFGQPGSGDIDGDGLVDTDDLLFAISEWGDCDE
ncbi:MAG: S8 family serine peptidase [Phycisphaerales bacterium]|nr:S8 family serine peptidase [Phycisphaerales bacterium]